MNKKVNFGIALSIIVLITAGIMFFYFRTVGNQQPANSNKHGQGNQNVLANKKGEVITFARADGNYDIEVASKNIKPSDKKIDLASFSGLPKESGTIINSIALLAPGEDQALVVSESLDGSKKSTEPDGSVAVLNADEFLCNISSKSCQKTDILESAYIAAGGKGKWFSDQSLYWYGINTENSTVYGCTSSREEGDTSPVYAFNYNSKSIQQTASFDPERSSNKKAEIPAGAFSPTMKKFVMTYNFSDKWYLYLYDSSNLSAPLKKIDVTTARDAEDPENTINSVAWASDEKTLALATDNQIYTLNLDNDQISSVYVDMVDDNSADNGVTSAEDDSGQGMDSDTIAFSSNGKYVAFIYYDDNKAPSTILKAIDLKNGNTVIDLLEEDGISLDVQ